MKNNSHLTPGYDPILERQIARSVPGQAHFAASGPFGTTCAECSYYGYWRQRKNAAGDEIKPNFRKTACGKYFQLTKKHGPPFPANTESCRHFVRKDGP